MKKVLVSVFGVLFIAVVGVLAWKVLLPGTTAVTEAVATDILLEPTKLIVTQGQATVNRTGASAIKVTSELEVKEGDAIQVDASGKASIEWSDGSVTRLAGGTDMTITKAVIDAASGKQEAEIDVRSGQVWSKVLNVVHDDSTMQVRAQNTVAGIRGTSLYTSVSSTGIVMVPFEHGVEMTMEGTRSTLMEGEGMTIRGTTATRMGSGAVMNAFITESENADDSYLMELAAEREKLFKENLKNTKALPDFDAFDKEFSAEQGTAKEKSNKLGGLMDRLVAEIIAAREAGDTVRVAELTEYYEELVPLMQQGAQGDLEMRDAMRARVQMHMAVLFSDGMTDEDFLTRQAVLKARLALMDPNDDARLRRVLRKELFIAADLASSGKDRQVEEQLNMLRSADIFKKPLMDNASDMDKEMFEKIGARIAAEMPSTTGGMDGLRKQLFTEKVEKNSNQNANANQNTAPAEEPVTPVTNTNTNTVRRTNTNTNTRVNNTNTNAKKPATTTTTPKPTPTATTPTPTVTPAVTTPAPATLVPAPVRTTTTTRPVVTQPR